MDNYDDFLSALEREMKKAFPSLEEAEHLLGGIIFYAEGEELKIALLKAKEISCHEEWQEKDEKEGFYHKNLLERIFPFMTNADHEVRVSATEIVAAVLLKLAEHWRVGLSIENFYGQS